MATLPEMNRQAINWDQLFTAAKSVPRMRRLHPIVNRFKDKGEYRAVMRDGSYVSGPYAVHTLDLVERRREEPGKIGIGKFFDYIYEYYSKGKLKESQPDTQEHIFIADTEYPQGILLSGPSAHISKIFTEEQPYPRYARSESQSTTFRFWHEGELMKIYDDTEGILTGHQLDQTQLLRVFNIDRRESVLNYEESMRMLLVNIQRGRNAQRPTSQLIFSRRERP